MTVSAQTPINRSTGNGVTTVFPYTFKIISTADIEVTVDDVVKTLNVDYTVSGAGVDAGGNVTMTTAPANGASVVRRRNMALTRSTDYQDQGTLPAATLDSDIDATVLMVQQLDERLDRTFSLPASFSGDSTLPEPEPGYLIGWDATGENLTNIPASVGSSLVDLAASSGSSLVGFIQSGTGAVPTTVQAKLRESVSVKDFGAVGDGVTDDRAAIQLAIDYASATGRNIFVPAGNYRLTKGAAQTDEAGTTYPCLTMASNMHILAEHGATFKLADSQSTDGAPTRFAMFFSNAFLSNISIKNLTIDMNGANNSISPNRGTLSFNRYTQAHILFSGTPGGVAAGGNNVHIEGCSFLNTAGVTCIGMAQSNTVGVVLGTKWKILNNLFSNNGLDTDDHSSVYGWADDVYVSGNIFTNPAAYNDATHTGGLVAYEIHGSGHKIVNNTIHNYYQGLWISCNTTTECRDIVISGNKAVVSQTFCDFYSANLGLGAAPDTAIQGVAIHGNIIDITDDAVGDQVKAFFKIAARRQPTMVSIKNNICRSFETAKNTTLCTVIVSPEQLAIADFIEIEGNSAAGINVGLIVYFGAAFDCNAISFQNNKLGNLVPSPGGLYVNRDVFLYGVAAGKVQTLRLGGLETPVSPVGTDAYAGGRATVYGKALLDLTVTWSGVTIGNGGYSKKIAIDTDAGHLIADIGFIAGSTTTYSGNIAPAITGISADASSVATATHFKTGAATPLAALVFNTGDSVSLYQSSGALFDSSQTTISSSVFVSAQIPCRSVNI